MKNSSILILLLLFSCFCSGKIVNRSPGELYYEDSVIKSFVIDHPNQITKDTITFTICKIDLFSVLTFEKIKNINLLFDTIRTCSLITPESMYIQGCRFQDLNLYGHYEISNFSYFDCEFLKLNFDTFRVTPTYKVTGLVLLELSSRYSLCHINMSIFKGRLPDVPIQLKLNGIDINKVDFDINDNFNLDTAKLGISDYRQILRRLEDLDLKNSPTYKNIDLQYQYKIYSSSEKGQLYLAFQEFWWNYGYDKSRLALNTLKLFGFFYFINLLFFKTLVTQVYTVPQLEVWLNEVDSKVSNMSLSLIKRSPFCLLYTLLIFFGVKFDVDRIKVKYLPLLFLVIAEYITGLICLFFIAKFLITNGEQ